ncbi:tyrosine-type recombinase/integrase [Pelosinus propionicus]|uniref:Site-specific recombinase XerD n=1 Tax=Pelosinus propionicus DSM 13327 TaxID=1123291 RepID=A0A1I4PGB6_9FIRM|nr:tyrosine-type recombinase/integrase [Pelosinus propionicus]SFM26852.1 Site-specific recombinase XerD [Pelosinus propionicus DSM 13327]
MNYPSKDEFIDYCVTTRNPLSDKMILRSHAVTIHNQVIKRYPNPKDFIESADDKFRGKVFPFYIFMCLKCRPTIPIYYLNHPIYYGDKIVKYFNLINADLLNSILKLIKSENEKKKFLVYVVRFCISSEYKTLNDISIENVRQLKNSVVKNYNNFSKITQSSRITYLNFIERALTPVNMPKKFTQRAAPDEKQFGTPSSEIIGLVKKYLQEKYIAKGYDIATPRMQIKYFLSHVTKRNPDIRNLNEIFQNDYWCHYRELIEKSSAPVRSKSSKINSVMQFFEWLFRNGCVTENELPEDYGYRWKRNKIGLNDEKPKMFQTRDHYFAIFAALLNFKPKTEEEVLCKHFFLVITAIGARKSEILWLTPNSITNIKDGIGEVTFAIKEKLGLINKPMSCMPWGLHSIKFLEDRLEKGPKIKFFHKRTGKEFYSLFEHNGYLLSEDVLYRFFDRLMVLADIKDESGNRIKYKGIRFHAFRHQKFNDIYTVTNGSLSAVQHDSNHVSIRMVKRYTQQDISMRRLTAIKAIEEGKIVGKGVDLLNALLESPFTPEQYMNVVKKLNFSTRITKELVMEAAKDLGFGFCTNPNCAIAPMCEACDYYFTCKEQLEELKERYTNNFLLIKKTITLVGFDTFFKNEEYRHLIIGLKHQERWLKELDVTDEEITDLKHYYFKE